MWQTFSPKSILLPCLFVCLACGSAPHDVAKRVPLGSKLADLDQYIERGEGSQGEVSQWIAVKGHSPADLTNKFGTFTVEALGSYDEWKASPDERNRFTGKITFFHRGSTSADANTLTYREGKLVDSDWGFLPG